MADDNLRGTNHPRTEDEIENMSLKQVFDSAFDLMNSIHDMREPTDSSDVQIAVRQATKMFEEATKIVSMISMFSDNEEFEDVDTDNIQYLLLPALLGALTLKLCGPDDRMHIIEVAEIYFIDFLTRVKAYGLTDINIPDMKKADDEGDTSVEKSRTNAEMVTDMVNRRNTKLQRYKEQKQLESKLSTLKAVVANPNADDEVKRDYFLTLIRIYVLQIIDEFTSLSIEKQILKHMNVMKRNEGTISHTSHKHKQPTNKLQPIIITRDEVQKKVYGLGYPSLPIMTVKEFYEQRVKDGEWPDPSKYNEMNAKSLQNMSSADKNAQEEAEDTAKEEKIEKDDAELLAQARAMDEYKDTHRRGWGNRANRS